MNKDRMEKWVAALESGKYEKTTYALKTWQDGAAQTSYCAVGVALRVYANARKKKFSYDTREAAKWFGVELPEDADPRVRDYNGLNLTIGDTSEDTIVNWNDRSHRSFTDIAQAIRKTYGIGG